MSEPAPTVVAEESQARADSLLFYMRVGVFFLVIALLTVVVYGLVAGIFMPPAPRTQLESSLLRADAATDAQPKNGTAWAALAGSLWASGDEAAAREAVAHGQAQVTDASIIPLNNRDLDFLLAEERDEELLKRADEYVRIALKFRSEEASSYVSAGIATPELTHDKEIVRLYVLKASAEGNLKRWDEAVESLTKGLALEPKAADVLTLRGWARLRSGDSKGAAEDFESALKYLPGDASATEGLKAAKNTPSDQ